MFTHWGEHGLGDYARIPLINSFEIENINWMDESFIEIRNDIVNFKKFQVVDDKLIGELLYVDGQNFFVLDLKNSKYYTFESLDQLNNYTSKQLNISLKLESFHDNYNHYWSGWRFWFLP